MEHFFTFHAIAVSCAAVLFAVTYYLKQTSKLDSDKKPMLLKFTNDSIYCKSCIRQRTSCGKECSFAKLKYIVSLIRNATESVDVCVCILSNKELADALVAAHARRIKVRVILDYTMAISAQTKSKALIAGGVPLRMKRTVQQMHHKFCIIDGNTPHGMLVTGSLNWTYQAFVGNFECVTIIKEEKCIKAFVAQFEQLWDFFGAENK